MAVRNPTRASDVGHSRTPVSPDLVSQPVEESSPTDDAPLDARIRRGDPAAEDLLVQLYAGRVLMTATLALRDREAARELTDDALMAAILALRRGAIRDTSRLAAYIHGTTKKLIANYIRNARRRRRNASHVLAPVVPDITESLEHDQELDLLWKAVGHLDARDSDILLLAVGDSLGCTEIANRLGISRDVVRQRKRRALKRLLTALGTVRTQKGPDCND